MEATKEQVKKLTEIANRYDELEAIEEIEKLLVTPEASEPIGYTTSTGFYIHVMPDGSTHT